jgi:formamidopyrimidine-DNA glycosylase
MSTFDQLAPDALEIDDAALVEGLVGKSTAIKSLLLDQKKVLSGVGNWVADEVLFQSAIHPDQTFLTASQVGRLLGSNLRSILRDAIDCLDTRTKFPETWLFHVRWNKRSKDKVKDHQGRTVSFIQSAGRTSAIVPKIQIMKKAQQKAPKPATKTARGKAAQSTGKRKR